MDKLIMEKEIKIAGGGLAGLTAALNLIKAGYRTTVYEQKAEVGMRFNGDFQGIENWTTEKDVLELLKEMNIKPIFWTEPVFKGIIYGPNLSESVNFSSNEPIFYLVSRGSTNNYIDLALKQQLIDLGGKIILGERISPDKVDIIATGPERAKIIASGYVFNTNLEDTVSLILDNNIAPRAYAYLIVKNKKGSIAVVLSQDFQKQNEYLEKAVGAFNNVFNLKMEDKKRFGGYGNFFIPLTAVKDNKLLVGEAAGFQDYLAGFGMYYAIRSGFLAAKSIIEEQSYNKLWKQEFENTLKASLVNRFLQEIIGNRGYRFILKRFEENKENTTALLKREYHFGKRRKLLYPFAYLFKKPKQ